MKKLIILTFLLFVYSISYSQSNLMSSVFGIELGSKRQVVKDILLNKQPESKIYSETDVSVSYQDLKWGEFDTYLVIFQFSDDDRMHTTMIFLEPDHCQNVFSLYDKTVDIINERYYTTNKKTEYYSYPYDRKDKYRYTESMVKNGKVTMQSLWSFDTRNTPDINDDDNHLKVHVSDDCLVIVNYQDGLIIDEVLAKKKKQDSKDY